MLRKFFGKFDDGKEAFVYTLKNDECELRLSDYGATVLSLTVFGRDVVGGFDRLEDYINDDSHQGATIGRVANRIANARFSVDGKEYSVTANNNGNCLHGGTGFDFKLWGVKEYSDDRITFEYTSADGEEGFPASLYVTVTYILSGTSLIIDYEAKPDGKTPVALTNHSYFNLNGLGGDILGHTLTVYADRYTEVDDKLIPNGNRPSVAGTAFDFTKPHKVGQRIDNTCGGYDHNFILSPTTYESFLEKKLGLAAVLSGDEIKMSMYTDQPGVQVYSGNFLGFGADFKGGVKQVKHGAICLEAQTEPNAVNLGVGLYDAGEIYRQTTVYSFEKI